MHMACHSTRRGILEEFWKNSAVASVQNSQKREAQANNVPKAAKKCSALRAVSAGGTGGGVLSFGKERDTILQSIHGAEQ
jgi:hypothetical protein